MRTLATLICYFCAAALPDLQANVSTSIDAETQLKSWKLNRGALSLELIQRLPDQTRGFFLGRGFSSAIANDIATQCVLQAIGKNTSGTQDKADSISYDLNHWSLSVDGKNKSIKLKEQWESEWSTRTDISMAAKIAFRWATFPTQQEFEPGGDFNWGMISFGLPPGSAFDLQVVWKQNDEVQSHWIKNIQCPADR